jgi:hypothetical protein
MFNRRFIHRHSETPFRKALQKVLQFLQGAEHQKSPEPMVLGGIELFET